MTPPKDARTDGLREVAAKLVGDFLATRKSTMHIVPRFDLEKRGPLKLTRRGERIMRAFKEATQGGGGQHG